MNFNLAAFLMLLSIITISPGSVAAQELSSQIVGKKWYSDTEQYYFRFNSDGTYSEHGTRRERIGTYGPNSGFTPGLPIYDSVPSLVDKGSWIAGPQACHQVGMTSDGNFLMVDRRDRFCCYQVTVLGERLLLNGRNCRDFTLSRTPAR